MKRHAWIWVPAGLLLAAAVASEIDRAHAAGPAPVADPGVASRFFLPTAGDARNVINPTIETDAAGRLHMIYPAYAIGDAFYATCDDGCARAEDVKSVKLETDGTVANAMLAIGPDGRPQALLATFHRVYYATCTGDCTRRDGWKLSVIRDHAGDEEVTGEAFAIAPSGKPAFVAHTTRMLFGIGQKQPATKYLRCAGDDCHDRASWKETTIVPDQIWQESTLRFDARGRPRLATIAIMNAEPREAAAYAECNEACDTEKGWTGVGLLPAFSDRQIERIDPAIAMELTPAGGPRVAVLARNPGGKRNLAYMACDSGCTDGKSWAIRGLIELDSVGAGVDLALAGGERPRIVYTVQSNIFLAHCDKDCGEEKDWGLAKVELGSEMKRDDIFLYPNCTVAAWFLRHPSIALGKDGQPRVAYRAEDMSGGFTRPDITRGGCRAGADMTLARFARVIGVRR